MSATVHTFPLMTDIAAWRTHMRARGLAERTITEQTRTVERIAEMIGTRPRDLSTEQLAVWFGHQTIGNSSRSTYRTALRAFFDYLILSDIRLDDPTRKLGKVKLPRRQPRPITTDHLMELLGSGVRRDWAGDRRAEGQSA